MSTFIIEDIVPNVMGVTVIKAFSILREEEI